MWDPSMPSNIKQNCDICLENVSFKCRGVCPRMCALIKILSLRGAVPRRRNGKTPWREKGISMNFIPFQLYVPRLDDSCPPDIGICRRAQHKPMQVLLACPLLSVQLWSARSIYRYTSLVGLLTTQTLLLPKHLPGPQSFLPIFIQILLSSQGPTSWPHCPWSLPIDSDRISALCLMTKCSVSLMSVSPALAADLSVPLRSCVKRPLSDPSGTWCGVERGMGITRKHLGAKKEQNKWLPFFACWARMATIP